MTSKIRTLLLAAATVAVSAVALAGPSPVPKRHNYPKTVTKTSATILPANQARSVWCIEASACNAASIWYTTSTASGVTQTARTTNGQELVPGQGHCEDGGSTGIVYSGAITVIAVSTSGTGCPDTVTHAFAFDY